MGDIIWYTTNELNRYLNLIGGHMPALSTFFGIIVYMYKELGGKHSIPHIHVGDDYEKAGYSQCCWKTG